MPEESRKAESWKSNAMGRINAESWERTPGRAILEERSSGCNAGGGIHFRRGILDLGTGILEEEY